MAGKVLVICGGIALLAFGLGALLGTRLGGTHATSAQPLGPPVVVPPVAPSDPPVDRNGFVGVVFARQQVDLESTVEARVVSVPVQLGDHVKKGDPVATLDAEPIRRDLAAASAAVRTAETQAHAARVEYQAAQSKAQRLQKLAAASQSVSEEELENAVSAVHMAESNLGTARSRVDEAEKNVERLQTLLSTTAILATFDGVVAQRYVDPGTVVGPGRPIVRLISAEDVWVRFAVPEEQVASVSAGGCVDATVPSLKLTTRGKVATVAPQIDAASRMLVVEARLEVPPAWQGHLPVGLEARVRGHACAPDPG